MIQHCPEVTVILPVYNAEKFLASAIESVLNQSFGRFELLVINDGSGDSSEKIAKSYQTGDSRVVLISRENKGLVKTLNEGVRLARGKYIARMDADDVCLPLRLEMQYRFLENNPSVQVVGSDFEYISESGKVTKKIKVPKTSAEIAHAMCYGVPFAHPSVMGRKEFFLTHEYRPHVAEDQDLWVRGWSKGSYANINKTLFQYRHDYGSSFSDTKRLSMLKEQREVSMLFYKKNKSYIKRTLEKDRISSIDSFFLKQSFSKNFFNFSFVNVYRYRSEVVPSAMFFLVRDTCRSIYWRVRSFL